MEQHINIAISGYAGMTDRCSHFWQHCKASYQLWNVHYIHKASCDRICQKWQNLKLLIWIDWQMLKVARFGRLTPFQISHKSAILATW